MPRIFVKRIYDMHDRFWTGRIAEHVAVGQNLCYTWSIIGKEGDL